MESILPVIQVVLQVIQVITAVATVLLVLIHSPKGDGLASIGGTAQIFSSQKGAEAALNKITAYNVGVFFLVSFILGYYF